jgi:hypothetical protein
MAGRERMRTRVRQLLLRNDGSLTGRVTYGNRIGCTTDIASCNGNLVCGHC